MVRLSKRGKRFFASLLMAVIIGLAFCLFAHSNLLYRIHLQSSDFLFRTPDATQARPDGQIVIVAIDEASLDQLGRFSSWPRTYHSQILGKLTEGEARLVVFDILFAEASPEDIELAAAIKQAGNVILPFGGKSESPQAATVGEITGQQEFVKPVKLLEESSLGLGHAYITPDEDGLVRRLPVIIPSNGSFEPALSLTSAAKFLRRPQIVETSVIDNYLTLAGRLIPVDNANGMLINYSTDSPFAAFKTVSYGDVLRNEIPPDTFKDKIVLIGATAIGFGDNFWTPLGQMLSGVELQANAIHTILSGEFLKPASASVTDLSIMLLSLICGLAVLRFRIRWAIMSAIFLAAGYLITAFYFFDKGTMMDLWYPPLSLAGTFVGVNLHNLMMERNEKGEITRTFGRYVSAPVAIKILNTVNKGELKLGGEQCTATVLFADVRNFTGFSEKTVPQELVSILNQYLSVIIKVALEHDGMVNKFGGDRVMVVWNVPINCPQHSLAATRAAIRIQEEIKELQERTTHLPKMDFGIGINTGTVVAGNMGSIDRLEYSVIGDAVNIAAKLADTVPGNKIWIGAEAYTEVQDCIMAKRLEPLLLKGRHEAVQVYELADDSPATDNGNPPKSFLGG
jgi:adenylate cyclase